MKLRKRQKFVLVSIILSLLMIGIELSGTVSRVLPIILLGLAVIPLSYWALWEGFVEPASYLALVLPISFTVGVGFFYFLLPSVPIARLPVVVLFGIGIYALLLTANIYTVAAVRTIALLRAAQAVGYVLTLVTLFFLYDTLLSYRLAPWWNAVFAAGISFPLYLQAIWSTEVGERIRKRELLYALVLSAVVGELGATISLWPITVTIGSIFLTTMGYILIGISQHEFSGRLLSQTVKEYLAVGIAVFVTMLLTTRWGG
jgi:hypothetical protein